MNKKLFFVGVIFLLLVTTAATPFSVRAEGDSPPNPEPVKPPWITGKNPLVSISSNPEEDLTASGIIDTWQGVEVPLLAAPPTYVDLEPQSYLDSPPDVKSLAIPQRYQDPSDVTCGAAALGMALEFLSLNGEGASPSQETLVGDLKNSGLLYETGTGVEELAYLARQHGYQGTTAVHDWTLEQLGGQLAAGRPVVVSLGANGVDQPGHFVTLTGISEDGSWVSYNDPILGNQTISAETFLKSWNLQGNSGIVVQKEPLPAAADPMLPWMGLFSALTMLAVMAKQYPLGKEFTSVLADIRSGLSNPLRKGLGGKLIAEGGSSSSPPYTAPPGYKWKKNLVTKYGWKDIHVTTYKEVPRMVRESYQVTNVWYDRVPRYRTVRVDEGRWAWRTVKKTKRERYVRYYKTTRTRVKKYYYRRGRRYSYYTYKTKRTPVYGYRTKTTYKRERYWASKFVTKRIPDGTRLIRREETVTKWRTVQQGTKRIPMTTTERKWTKVGTEYKWKLEKLPKPTPTPTPYPSSTPAPGSVPYSPYTPTPYPPSTTTTPSTPTPSSTPYPSYTPIPTITPTPSSSYVPSPVGVLADEQSSLIVKIGKLIKSSVGIKEASGLSYNLRPNGNWSVSAPLKEAGEKLNFRLNNYVRGTYYTADNLAKATSTSLMWKAAKGIGISLATSVGKNVYDYGLGEHADIGIKSNEFAASTAVDFAQAGLTGVAAAGAAAGLVMIGAAVGLTAPLWAGVLLATGIGIGISAAVSAVVDTDKIKEKVADGFATVPGIIENGKIIVSAGAEKLGNALENAGTGEPSVITKVIKDTAQTVSDIVLDAANAVSGLVGSLFGGND